MTRPRRLLIAVNNPGFFLSHRLPVAVAARRAGFDVHVATPDGPAVPAIRDAGLEWHPIHLSRSGTRPLEESRSVHELWQLYRRLRPDVAHHVTPKVVLYGTTAARLARVPGVVNAISGLGHAFAGTGSAISPLRMAASTGYRLLLRHPRMRVIFQNEDHRRLFVAHRWIRDDEAVLIRGSGVDTAVFAPRERESARPLVVLAARMLRTKGVGEFVEAARLLHDRGVAARFALVGSPDPGNPATVTEAELREWSGEGVVEHWGFRNDMARVYAEADVACLPSYTEGMPKSLIEAAACGLPIVATDEPGCRGVVRDGENGLLVPVGAVPELAAALERLIADPALRARLGAAGRALAVSEFDIEHVVAAHLAVYDALTIGRGSDAWNRGTSTGG
jgi:glycosyltransferase involved in cell wall biosynthesis